MLFVIQHQNMLESGFLLITGFVQILYIQHDY